MVLRARGAPLTLEERPDPVPGAGEIRVRVEACAVCRTDLHVIDGELPHVHHPIVPGHEIVGVVEALGPGPGTLAIGQRVGIPWLGRTCGHCEFCLSSRENLCDQPVFTGYDRDGGFATHVVADAAFAIPMDAFPDPVASAPLLCAGLIGWRSLVAAGEGRRIGLYGFGAAAHVIAQVCRWQGREVFAFTRAGDQSAQTFARSLGAVWAGASEDVPPELLDAAIIFAPAGEVVEANPAWLHMFGYPDLDSLRQVHAAAIYAHPEDRRRYLDAMTASDVVSNFEFEARRREQQVERAPRGQRGRGARDGALAVAARQRERHAARPEPAHGVEGAAHGRLKAAFGEVAPRPGT